MAKILIVDDDREILGMLKRLLERNNHEVIEAVNGTEAIKLYRKNPADLIITDIVMPEIGGLEILRVLQGEYPNLKLIAISGGALIGPGTYLKMAKQLGAIKTFTKPFNIKDLQETVNEALTS